MHACIRRCCSLHDIEIEIDIGRMHMMESKRPKDIFEFIYAVFLIPPAVGSQFIKGNRDLRAEWYFVTTLLVTVVHLHNILLGETSACYYYDTYIIIVTLLYKKVEESTKKILWRGKIGGTKMFIEQRCVSISIWIPKKLFYYYYWFNGNGRDQNDTRGQLGSKYINVMRIVKWATR